MGSPEDVVGTCEMLGDGFVQVGGEELAGGGHGARDGRMGRVRAKKFGVGDRMEMMITR